MPRYSCGLAHVSQQGRLKIAGGCLSPPNVAGLAASLPIRAAGADLLLKDYGFRNVPPLQGQPRFLDFRQAPHDEDQALFFPGIDPESQDDFYSGV